MDRVLKRIGLSKRTQSDADVRVTNLDENVKVRRRRRSKSRRLYAQENKKNRGLFHIDWDTVKDCKSCKSRAITKKFCSKKVDNELYRSNSFKFERFIRGNEELSTLGKKISLCDDYSFPVDHVTNKRRPNSIAVTNTNCKNFSDWILSSPNEGKVEILDTYSTPRDSKPQINLSQDNSNELKCLTSPDREYSQPYTTDESRSTSDEDFKFCDPVSGNPANVELNSPDSINEGVLPLSFSISPSKTEASSKRHPSPYYYGDLFKYKTSNISPPKDFNNICKENQKIKSEHEKESKLKSVSKTSRNHRKFRKSSSLDNPLESREKTITYKSSGKRKESSRAESRGASTRESGDQMPPNPVTIAVCDDYGLDDMTRQRHVYETAFDCQISKSNDDLEQIDKVTNHPVLVQVKDNWYVNPAIEPAIDNNSLGKSNITTVENSQKSNKDDTNSVLVVSQDLQNMHLTETKENNSVSSGPLPLCGFTPSPPSTAPLPSKFHGKGHMMNSIRSAPNLPSHPKTRLKNLHLPVKSFRGRSPTSSSDSLHIHQGNAFETDFAMGSNQLIAEFKGRPGQSNNTKNERIFDITGRPRKGLFLNNRSKDLLGRRMRHKYSSSDSMTTSSSGGSMESIKSSTSEGNRSTSSSESRQSASLSSHSSDSGGNNKAYTFPQISEISQLGNKLHILSPISDKSSQEPISEVSENTRNNNSQKCSPEETVPNQETLKTKRRIPQNKNLLNLANPEIQGSDSGISIQSREGIKSRFSFAVELSASPSQQDFSDLPFDMPKLRRRRILAEGACTSSSATSMDFRDLPFDMPKLKRRMRLQSSNLETSASQASSSQSVVETDRQVLSPKLSLDLGQVDLKKQHPSLQLSLGLGLSLHTTDESNCSDTIDTNLPLEKQGWFHGSISRIEAENVLRALGEGSFLVRNSESIKHDFSLSLKSARGFMHMRIQKNTEDGCFILGQFSKPFNSIPEMIRHYSINRLPIRGAEHMCLIQPVIAQLL